MKKILLWLYLTISLVVGLMFISVQHNKTKNPDLAVVLGGDWKRIEHAINLAKQNKDLKVLISGHEKNSNKLQELIKTSKLSNSRFIVDVCATDTVTNFTCIVQTLTESNAQHVLLVTSDYHMNRALAIGSIVLGSRKIAMTPIRVNSNTKIPEPNWKTLRDVTRSVVWLVTGKTGAGKERANNVLKKLAIS